jgi:hypothetical protein
MYRLIVPALSDAKIVVSQVDSTNDDAEEQASGSVSRGSSDLELVDGQTVGMRFNRIDIPQGATIIKAYIQFTVDETDSVDAVLKIEGEDVDDAQTFSSSSGDISSRDRTSTDVEWRPMPWTSVGDAYDDQKTPDITSVIQKIVDRDGWASGNSLVIIITGDGVRTAESYNGDRASAPVLHVEFGEEETIEESICDDGTDNDQDDDIDCDDPDCIDDPACVIQGEQGKMGPQGPPGPLTLPPTMVRFGSVNPIAQGSVFNTNFPCSGTFNRLLSGGFRVVSQSGCSAATAQDSINVFVNAPSSPLAWNVQLYHKPKGCTSISVQAVLLCSQ